LVIGIRKMGINIRDALGCIRNGETPVWDGEETSGILNNSSGGNARECLSNACSNAEVLAI
jgi:hypothetical protein